MTMRQGSATPRQRTRSTASTDDEYQAGHRFGRAWLLTDEGREWELGIASREQSPVRSLRRLATEHGREYLRGFYDAVLGRDSTEIPVSRTKRRARPVTVSVTLTTEEYAALKSVQTIDGVPTATRIRAMIEAYTHDSGFRKAIDSALKGE